MPSGPPPGPPWDALRIFLGRPAPEISELAKLVGFVRLPVFFVVTAWQCILVLLCLTVFGLLLFHLLTFSFQVLEFLESFIILRKLWFGFFNQFKVIVRQEFVDFEVEICFLDEFASSFGAP